jgi:hypothetical protein
MTDPARRAMGALADGAFWDIPRVRRSQMLIKIKIN